MIQSDDSISLKTLRKTLVHMFLEQYLPLCTTLPVYIVAWLWYPTKHCHLSLLPAECASFRNIDVYRWFGSCCHSL